MLTDDTLIDFIRHGEPEGGRRFRGHSIDDPLSERGWQQMWQAVGSCDQWNLIISSPMQRCHRFAQALADKIGVEMEIESNFREIGFGCWEGRSPDEIIREDPAGYSAFYADPVNAQPEGAEPLADFARRVSSALQQKISNHAGKRLLIVAHAGVIRAALGHIIKAEPIGWYRCQIDTAGITRFRLGQHGLKLEFHNRTRL
jgi:broad specificity phosphatase PhoE